MLALPKPTGEWTIPGDLRPCEGAWQVVAPAGPWRVNGHEFSPRFGPNPIWARNYEVIGWVRDHAWDETIPYPVYRDRRPNGRGIYWGQER